MPRILFVAQQVGGCGKSTVVRGIAEALADVPIFEIESTPRIREYDHDRQGSKRVRYFSDRADRASINATGGQAARREFDPVINAMIAVHSPIVADIGANAANSLLGSFDDELVAGFSRAGVELGFLAVITADPAAVSQGAKLLASAKGWAKARFVVENRLRGNVDPALLAQITDGVPVTVLEKSEFEPRTIAFLQAVGLHAIPQLTSEDFQVEHGFNEARRMVGDLKAFRLAVMQAVLPAATWLAS
jgi:GNAT superfamily N-acetyltransferase